LTYPPTIVSLLIILSSDPVGHVEGYAGTRTVSGTPAIIVDVDTDNNNKAKNSDMNIFFIINILS
jgi:hypothetical protein